MLLEGVPWTGWARHGRAVGKKWHRVIVSQVDGATIVEPICGAMRMHPDTVVMDPDFDPRPLVCPACELNP